MDFDTLTSGPASDGTAAPTPRSDTASFPPSSPRLSSNLPGSGLGSSRQPNSDFGPAAEPMQVDEQEIDEVRRMNQADLQGIPKVTDGTGEKVRELFEQFLSTYSTNDNHRYYLSQINGMRVYGLSTIYISFEHLQTTENGGLAEAVVQQYYRFLPFLLQGLRNVIKRYEPALLYPGDTNIAGATAATGSGASDTQSNHASQTQSQTQSALSTTGSTLSSKETDKVFQIAFFGLPLVNRIREMRTNEIGRLAAISGTVTRTSEVRPELYKATFTCDECRTVVPDVEQVFKYTEPYMCPSPTCGNKTAWTLVVPKSTFLDWQRVRIQENPGEIPTGSMPRSLDVILRGEIVDRAKPGDKCVFTGSLAVIPDVSQYKLPGVRPSAVRDNKGAGRGEGMDGAVHGLKAMGVRELSYKMAFIASMVQEYDVKNSSTKSDLRGADDEDSENQEEFLKSLTEEEVQELREMVNTDHLYSKLVNSIAPAVHGHVAIKKGILLQLMSGVHKETPEGIQLRGDINVCIVGDPSTSKSQFLKYVTSFLPRSVYTSGKASSAAGLTAAVVKDEESGEFTIEAGALMLADNGICAIDEFDKMDVRDQVAIHEAMEQQTISIAKAGIHATLNARTSILAAANPIGGRYDRRKSLRANIYMSAPIMSRFDLFFVVLDEVSEATDRRLAEHIVNVHMSGDLAIESPFTTAQLQRYIQYARTFKPRMTKEARLVLVDLYKRLRSDDAPNMGQRSYRITVRQLESLIRLSEAVARAHCVDEVTEDFVREAYNLLKQSTISVDYDDVDVDGVELIRERTVDRSRTQHALEPESEAQIDSSGRSRTRVTQEKYSNMVQFILQVIGPDPDARPLTRSELVRLYLANQEASITNEAELDYESDLIKKVLKRLVRQNMLMELHGVITNEGDRDLDDVQYVLHPNSTADIPSD